MTEKNLPSKSFDSSSSTVVLPADMAINDRIVGIYKSAQNRWIDDLSEISQTLAISKKLRVIIVLCYILSYVLSAAFGAFFTVVVDNFLKNTFSSTPAFWSFVCLISFIIVDYIRSKSNIDDKAIKKDIDRTLKDMKLQQKTEI